MLDTLHTISYKIRKRVHWVFFMKRNTLIPYAYTINVCVHVHQEYSNNSTTRWQRHRAPPTSIGGGQSPLRRAPNAPKAPKSSPNSPKTRPNISMVNHSSTPRYQLKNLKFLSPWRRDRALKQPNSAQTRQRCTHTLLHMKRDILMMTVTNFRRSGRLRRTRRISQCVGGVQSARGGRWGRPEHKE